MLFEEIPTRPRSKDEEARDRLHWFIILLAFVMVYPLFFVGDYLVTSFTPFPADTRSALTAYINSTPLVHDNWSIVSAQKVLLLYPKTVNFDGDDLDEEWCVTIDIPDHAGNDITHEWSWYRIGSMWDLDEDGCVQFGSLYSQNNEAQTYDRATFRIHDVSPPMSGFPSYIKSATPSAIIAILRNEQTVLLYRI